MSTNDPRDAIIAELQRENAAQARENAAQAIEISNLR